MQQILLILLIQCELRRLMVVGTNGFYASSKDGSIWDVSGNTSTNELKQVIWVKEQTNLLSLEIMDMSPYQLIHLILILLLLYLMLIH